MSERKEIREKKLKVWNPRKAQIRLERKCFWTRPLGHFYKDNKCAGCGKVFVYSGY